MLYTVGHSNYSINEFIKRLQGLGIKNFVDVRSKPYSRYAPHFNKKRLLASLGSEGIRYDWIGRSLGGLKGPSIKSEQFREGMQWVYSLADHGDTAICCMERQPNECHRATKLAEYIRQSTDRKVEHLLHDGELISHEAYRSQIPEHLFWHELHANGKYGK